MHVKPSHTNLKPSLFLFFPQFPLLQANVVVKVICLLIIYLLSICYHNAKNLTLSKLKN